MSDNSVEQVQKRLFEQLEMEIKAGNKDKAIEIGISSYFFSKGYGKEYEKFALSKIYLAFVEYLDIERIDPLRCSFCGNDKDNNKKMGAGLNANICEDCVRLFYENFRSK